MKIQKRTFALLFYFLLLVMPIYWMLNMSLRSNADILSTFSPCTRPTSPLTTISRCSRIRPGTLAISMP
jgi:ABC-type glycerol-3-phosphate transport system permease component